MEDYRFTHNKPGRTVYNNESALVELIKYDTEIFTEVDLRKKETKVTPHCIQVKAICNILLSMESHRLFDRFGFNSPVSKKPLPVQVITEDYYTWLYNTTITDWFCPLTDELLSEYKPPDDLQHLLQEEMDTELQ